MPRISSSRSIAAGCLFVLLLISGNACGDDKTLKIFTWSDYIDPDIVSVFEQRHKVKIQFSYFEDNDARDAALVNTNGVGYDLLLLNGIQVAQYHKLGWISPISKKDVPNIATIDKKWRSAFADTEKYAIPYFWGTLGIAYRSDLVSEKITSWRQLFNPAASLKGKIVLPASMRDVIGMALKSLGYSANSADPQQLLEAEQLLKTQKPFISRYGYIAINEQSSLLSGENHMAMVYSGDALVLQQHNKQIAYALPQEGSNLWVDYFAVSSTSDKRSLALAFLNYLNEPEVAASNAQFVRFATPNHKAEKLLPVSFLKNPIIYPPEKELHKSEFYRPLPVDATRTCNRVMADLIR